VPEVLLVEQRGPVRILTLNRPDVRNAVDAELATRLGDALDDAARDNGVRVLILTGSGDTFCAGADLTAVSRGERPHHRDPSKDWGFAGYVRHLISKPTIAAVNGPAVGGGVEIVLASDLAVAADSAYFRLPEVRHGVFPAAGGVFRLPAQVPRKIGLEMVLTGSSLDAARAAEVGLVNRVARPAELLDASLELARCVAEGNPLAVQAAKRVAIGMDGTAVPAETDSWLRSDREWEQLHARRQARLGEP
jgi:crotonobetainyl-CoA hydratase